MQGVYGRHERGGNLSRECEVEKVVYILLVDAVLRRNRRICVVRLEVGGGHGALTQAIHRWYRAIVA